MTESVVGYAVENATGGVALAVLLAVGVGMSLLVVRERRSREREQLARARAEKLSGQTLRLEAVARALLNARTADEVLDAILTEGLAAAEARAGLIGIVTEDGRQIEVAADRGYEDDWLGRWSRFRLDQQLPLSEAVRTGEPVYLSSTAERDRRYPLLASLTGTSHALVCLPLVFEQRTIGGLVLSFPSDQEFDFERRALKEALAAQAALALGRARLAESERRLRERLAFLAEASTLLASSLDYEKTLGQLASLAVPGLADWCSIDMLASDGSIKRLAVVHRDPAKVRYAQELSERYPVDRDAPTGVAQVLRSGVPEFIPEITDDFLVAATKGDPELLGIVRELGLRSVITVPLIAQQRVLGALSLIAAETVEPYGEAELSLAMELAQRAAVAVDNARLHAESEERGEAARALQHVADAVVLVDRDAFPRYWNRAAGDLLGESAGALAHWPELAGQFREREWFDRTPLILPMALPGQERWVQASRVEFDEGCVYALRDVTEERLLERTRSEFVATASHELRTPIAAVYGVFQTLLRDDLVLDRDRELMFLQMGRRESERLTRIVDDLLLAGQLDSAETRIDSALCELGELVGEVVDAATTRTNGSHNLLTSVDSALPPIDCDPLRLRQVLTNLVENAIKYSPSGSDVTVAAARDGNGGVRIQVADEGIGVPERDHGRIFERFVRLDPGLSRGVGGAGLGLYICRELVHRMGGKISLESQEGEGSIFSVELPISAKLSASSLSKSRASG